MEINFIVRGDASVIEVNAAVKTGDSHVHFRKGVSNFLDVGGKFIVIDFKSCPMIDSMGVGELLQCRMMAEERGAQIVLCDLSKPVRNVLELTKVISVFTCFSTQQEACDSINRG
jgi:anti-sigma B factor antagonist